MDATHTVTTANQPGAVAVVQVAGPDAAAALAAVTGRDPGAWPIGRLRLCDLAGIDEGLAGMVAVHTAQLMPHGGPRVVQRLCDWLNHHGAVAADRADASALYPEAASPIEADVLHAIATAASPAAVDRLAAQPQLWRDWFASDQEPPIRNQKCLDHLLTPPTVVVVGRPNVGKSTLLNRLTGRSSAVVADLPGTTRDWVGGMVELVPSGADVLRDAVAVRWLDTPGLRDSDDAVERRAIDRARELIERADVLIAMARVGGEIPTSAELPREPDLRLFNDFDPNGSMHEPGVGTCVVNAATGAGASELSEAVLGRLGLSSLPAVDAGRWAFSATLREAHASGDLAGYLGVDAS
ncbi:MAG: GTPase [Planctomycetota bacterium]